MHNLELKINISNWGLFKKRRANKSFKALASKVLQRDNYTCQFCGFRAGRFQQILNLDANYRNDIESNLATACILCAECHFIGAENFGKIIYLPEFSQAELNNLVRVLYCSLHSSNYCSDISKGVYRNLLNRSNQVEETFGEGSSHADAFGEAIIDASLDKNLEKNNILQNLRLLPSRNYVKKPVAYWAALVDKHWK